MSEPNSNSGLKPGFSFEPTTPPVVIPDTPIPPVVNDTPLPPVEKIELTPIIFYHVFKWVR